MHYESTAVKVWDLITCLNVKFLPSVVKYDSQMMAWRLLAESCSFLPAISCATVGIIEGYI